MSAHPDPLKNEPWAYALVNGCFDCLHKGHIWFIGAALWRAKARKMGFVLGLNSDRSIRKAKGEGRPIDTWRVRKKKILAHFPDIEIVKFENAVRLAMKVNPKVIYRGHDQQIEKLLLRRGFKFQRLVKFGDYSTTQCLESSSSATR